MTATLPDSILERLEGVKTAGANKWMAKCPAHEDKTASLSVAMGADGKMLLHCQASCTFHDVCRALRVEPRDLFPPRETTTTAGKHNGHNGHNGNPKSSGAPPRIVAEYDYVGAEGETVFQVVRYEPKNFKQRRPDP